jgi:tripartite-type tricarboxylate transporter receptor subunit TctC
VISRRNVLMAAAASAAIRLPSAHAQQASLPQGVFTIVVPFGPGGTADLMGRLMAQGLSAALGRTFIVENKPGAAAMIGARAVAKADRDGKTLLLATTGVRLNTLIYESPLYQMEELAPISLISRNPFSIGINPALPAKNMTEFVTYGKTAPKLNYASVGIGGPTGLIAEMIKKEAGLNMVEIPYKSSPDALASVISGQTDLYVDNIATSLPLHRDGKLRIVATTHDKRMDIAPDIPTLKEQGFPDIVIHGWYGMFAPTGTPSTLLSLLSAEIAKIISHDDFRKRAEEAGGVAASSTPAEFASFMENDTAKWNKIIQPLNIKIK